MLFATGCISPLLIPAEQDVSRAKVKWESVTLGSLKQGHQLYMSKCGSCHYLYRPPKFSEEKWKKEMPDMSERAKISKIEQEHILTYLLVMREAELSN